MRLSTFAKECPHSSRSSVAERPVGEWGRVGEVHWKVLLCQLLRHHLCCDKFAAVQDLGIDVRRGGDGAVAQHDGDYLEVDAGGQHEGGIRMAQRMQGNVWERGICNERFELAFRVIVVHVVAASGGEHHLGMWERLPGGEAFVPQLGLFFLLSEKHLSGFCTHEDPSDAVPRLRRREPMFRGNIRQVVTNVDDALVKVYVFPP